MTDAGPALVSILRQGSQLIASIHTALDDTQMVRFQQDLVVDLDDLEQAPAAGQGTAP